MSGTELAGITSSALADAAVQQVSSRKGRTRARGVPVDETEVAPGQPTDVARRAGLPSAVIHELRTPLTSIHGYAQVLQRSLRDNPRATNALGVVVRESTRLTAMLGELSEMAELESGETFSAPVEVEVEQVVADVVREIQRRDGGAHPITVTGHGLAHCNPTLLGQALLHVLANAAAFSPDQAPIGVTISPRRGSVEIQVSDEGHGIDEADADRIYEAFERGANARREAVRGLGLGLYLAREALARTHGLLDHHTRPDGGTVFRLLVPRG
jgi:signal transduction histidine kinase